MIKRESSRKSKATWLLTPILGENWEYFDLFGNFINCYSSCEDLKEYNRHLFLLYSYPDLDKLDPDDLEKMIKIENKLRQNHNNNKFIDMLDVSNSHVVAIYEVNDKYLPEFELFKQSKYSYFSPTYKEEIINFHRETSTKGLTKVLSRDKSMLQAVHRNIGCMKKECDCSIKSYLNCKYFDNFEFDMETSECWSKIGDEEHLDKSKYIIKDKV